MRPSLETLYPAALSISHKSNTITLGQDPPLLLLLPPPLPCDRISISPKENHYQKHCRNSNNNSASHLKNKWMTHPLLAGWLAACLSASRKWITTIHRVHVTSISVAWPSSESRTFGTFRHFLCFVYHTPVGGRGGGERGSSERSPLLRIFNGDSSDGCDVTRQRCQQRVCGMSDVAVEQPV